MYGIIATVLSGLSVVLDIVGLAIPYWLYGIDDDDGSIFYVGLWESCGRGADIPEICMSFPGDVPGAIVATRALELSGMSLLVLALAVTLLKQFVFKDKIILAKVGSVWAVVAGLLMIIGTIVFATDSTIRTAGHMSASLGLKLNLHAGFGLCIVAGVLALLSGIFMFRNKVISEEQSNLLGRSLRINTETDRRYQSIAT